MSIRLGEKEKIVIFSIEEYNSGGAGYFQFHYKSHSVISQFGYVTLGSPSQISISYGITNTGLANYYISQWFSNEESSVYEVYFVDSNSCINETIVGSISTIKQVSIYAQRVYRDEENPLPNIYYDLPRNTHLVGNNPQNVDAGIAMGFSDSIYISDGKIYLQNAKYSIISKNTTNFAQFVGKYYQRDGNTYQIVYRGYSKTTSSAGSWNFFVRARGIYYLDPKYHYPRINYQEQEGTYNIIAYEMQSSTSSIRFPFSYGLGYKADSTKVGGVSLDNVKQETLNYDDVGSLLKSSIIYLEIDGYVYETYPSEAFKSFSLINGQTYNIVYAPHSKLVTLLEITRQPEDQTVGVGGEATFSVEAESIDDISYQWQESADGVEWIDINTATGNTYSVIGTAENNGHRFRCNLEADNGATATTDVATLLVDTELKIVQQPTESEVWVGVEASFTCKASGDRVTYQWQRSDDGETWHNIIGATGTTYTITATKTDDGAQFRCIATDHDGNTLTSDAAILTANLVLGITHQPQDFSGKLNTTATFHVDVVGEGLQYQWYYSKNFTSFLVAQFDGATTDTMTLPIYGKYNNYKFYCIITDFEGTQVTTDTVSLAVEYEHSESEAGAGETYLGQNVKMLTTSDEFDGYSKVVINIDDETFVSAGSDDGRVLELECPWGTQQMASNILSSIRGFQYQPYDATGALLDPSAELGDGVTISGIYSGIYKRTVNFGSLSMADVSAPTDEEVDHEYPYETYTDRKVVRKFLETRAELRVTNALIEAKVSKTGGDNQSFGWSLTEEAFILSANDKEVFRANANGIKVDGEIRARTGYIGSDSAGFVIDSRSIHNGVISYSDTQHSGVYIGTDGIVLGKGAFKVDTNGNLTANTGTFKGSVYASNIQYGGSAGYFNGQGLTSGSVGGSQIGYGQVGSGNLSSPVNSDINLGVQAYNKLAYGFEAISTNRLYTSDLYVDMTGAYWCFKDGMFYLGHY